MLDTISGLQYRLAEYIAAMLKSEETADAVRAFIDRQVDELLTRRVDETLTDEALIRIRGFVADRVGALVNAEGFEQK